MSNSRLCLFVLLTLLIGAGGANASQLTTLHTFCSDPQGTKCLDGKTPVSRFTEIGGEFYGTAAAGGTKLNGTLFRISTTGTFTLLHSFCEEAHCTDGGAPGSYLTHRPNGTVYGVNVSGGVSDGGAIFSLSSRGTYSLVYKFCSKARCADGSQPVSVLFDGKGSLFGTAAAGGSHGSGTAFTIDGGGTFRVLHNFCSQAGCADGISPGALTLGRDGNFYGTTSSGGKTHSGTVFRMTPAGVVTVFYSFCSAAKCADGEEPAALLVEGRNGAFYGTTVQRGANGSGTIFEVTTKGAFHTLYSFCATSNCRDGATPTDGMVLAKDGSFYGAAAGGGLYFNGVIFHLTAAGKYSVVYDFCARHGCFDGSTPGTSPIFGSDGFLYGVTEAGGSAGSVGTAYRLEP